MEQKQPPFERIWHTRKVNIEGFSFVKILEEQISPFVYCLYKNKGKEYAVYDFKCLSKDDI